MNKNNIKAFEDGATEVTFFLTDEAIEFLKNAGYDDLLETYNNALNNDNVVEVFCQMTVAFFTDTVCDLCFTLSTYTYFNKSDDHDIDYIIGISFDRETAEYFKLQALKTLKRNFKDMQKCTHHMNK